MRVLPSSASPYADWPAKGLKLPRSFYARALADLVRRPRALVLLLLSFALHAVGHAVLALAAGASAVALLASQTRLRDLVAAVDAHASGVDPPTTAPVVLAMVGVCAATLKAGSGALAAYLQGSVSGEVGRSLRVALLDAWLGANPRDRAREDSSAVPSRPADVLAGVVHHVRDVELGMSTGVLGAVRALAQLVPLAALLLVLSRALGAVALAVLVVFGLGLSRGRRALKRAHAAEAREAATLLQWADDAVRHADLWRSFGAEGRVRRHVDALGAALARRSARLGAAAALLSGGNEVLGALAVLAALGAAQAGWLGIESRGPVLLVFTLVMFLAYRPLRDLGEARQAWLRAEAAFEALAPILRGATQGVLNATAPATLPAWGLEPLVVLGLALPHVDAPPLSFRVEPGQIVAVVGPSGAGKTTLLRTLLGLEAPRGGHIRYGDVALEDAGIGPAARPFAWMPQDAPLLADTLFVNVALEHGAARAEAALHAVGAAHLVEAVGDAPLAAAGRPLSGGERQRVALARALAAGQPVLLLDEPTSGLDATSEELVLSALAALRGRVSILLVTHRPAPLRIADAVLPLS